MSIWERYAADLSDLPAEHFVSLGEGDTPTVNSRWLGSKLGIKHLKFKAEHLNPSGSFKDRFAACAVSLMRQAGQTGCLCTSSGNAGAALAAYTAAAGIECHVAITEQTPQGKLAQMLAHGAKLWRIKGFGTDSTATSTILEQLRALAESSNRPLLVSAYAFCPVAADGTMTIAFELCEAATGAPDHVFVPVGGGGSLSGIAKGFALRYSQGLIPYMPRIHAVQPRLNDTLVTPLRSSHASARSVTTATAISGLAVPVDIDGTRALKSVRDSGGSGFLVDDDDVWAIQKDLMRREGMYVEPAGALACGGVAAAVRQGVVSEDDSVVCTLSGHGFKDPSAVSRATGDAEVPLIEPRDTEGVL